MIDHLSIQVDDIAASASFYDTVLGVLGYRRIMDRGVAMGYGAEFPSFWLGVASDEVPNRQSHIAFQAESVEQVQAFFDAAVGLGLEPLHEPRFWPEYHAGYYGAFVRDPDGNNVEAVFHDFTKAPDPG
ncbi:VOC family protein [soil metagenome]